jgi:hypothetical protein
MVIKQTNKQTNDNRKAKISDQAVLPKKKKYSYIISRISCSVKYKLQTEFVYVSFSSDTGAKYQHISNSRSRRYYTVLHAQPVKKQYKSAITVNFFPR